jgi:hypothetical protein
MNELLAPNGKPSNLTPEQYELVRSQSFKAWFGDWESKQFKNNHKPHSEIYPYDTIALDENGEPRIWHRATNYDYTEFDTEYIYLGSKKSYVKQYGKPKEFFIKPQKTIFIDNQDIERQKLGIKFDYLAEYISDENGIPRKGKNYDKLKKAFENQKEVLSVWEYFTLVGNKETLDLFKNWLNEYGFDSVMYWETGLKNNFGKYPVGLICLYFGNEIKLADGKNTTFDGSNPDIRFDKGGNINNEKQQLNKDMEYKNYAKGGKILGNITPQGFNHQEQQKYARIGVTDKYQIQAYIDMGLTGVNFDSVSLNNKLKKSLEELYLTYEDYLISEDSRGIDTFFLAQIRQAENQGQPAEMIEQIRINQTNPESRKQKINEVAEGQKLTLLTWIDYLKQSDYSTEFCYLLFNAILNFNYVLAKNDVVKRTKTTTEGFTPFSASVLAKLYDSKSNYLLKDYIELLSKEADNLVNELVTNEQDGGIWLTFLGKGNANDVEIKENAEKLSALVQRTQWCTTSRAESQLAGGSGYKGGNFYVFATNSDAGLDPQIAIRMDLDEVGEISGRFDGQYMSPEYSEIAIRFCRENIPNNSGEKYIKMLQYNLRVGDSISRLNEEGMYSEILSDYAYVVKNQYEANSRYGNNPNTKMFFDTVSTAINNLPNQYFEANEFSDSVSNLTPTTKYFLGDLTLSQYNNYDLGTSSLVEILGQLNIENNSTSFGQLQKIGGDLIISSPTIQSFDSIEYIGGQIKFTGTNLGLTSFGNLTEYGGTINCITQFTNLIDLGNLVECGDLIIGENSALETTGNLSVAKSILCSSSKNITFPNLVSVLENCDFNKSQTTDLPLIQRVGGNFNINSSRVKVFPQLNFIGGSANFGNNFTSTTQNIGRILGDLHLVNSRLKEFTNLTYVKGNIDLKGSLIESLGSIERTDGNIDLNEPNKLKSLGNLEFIGGYFNASGGDIESLGKLKQIIKFANFGNSKIQSLGSLESVGGSLFFKNSVVNNLGNLNYVGRKIDFGNLADLEAQWNQRNVQNINENFAVGGQTEAQKQKVSTVMREYKDGKLKTSYGEKVTNPKQAIAIALSEAGIKRKDDGGVLEISAYEGNIPLSLPKHYYSADSDVELVPVVDLMKFREFDRKKTPKYNAENSNYVINSLKESFKNEGIKEPLIIEYSVEDNSVLLIEGNHRLNTAIDMGLMYLPVRVVLRKNKFTPTSKKLSMQVDGIKPNEYGYIPSNLKPSQVGLSQTKKIFVEGGIIEGQLHSECNDETGCGVKFEVGEGGHIIEAERDEAVIVPQAFEINETMTITGTPSQIASALNVLGGGKNFDSGANIESKNFSGKTEQLKPMAKNTDVDYTIGDSSIIINRRTMADTGIYKAIGTPKQIASAINSMNGNGVEIGEVGKLEKIK